MVADKGLCTEVRILSPNGCVRRVATFHACGKLAFESCEYDECRKKVFHSKNLLQGEDTHRAWVDWMKRCLLESSTASKTDINDSRTQFYESFYKYASNLHGPKLTYREICRILKLGGIQLYEEQPTCSCGVITITVIFTSSGDTGRMVTSEVKVSETRVIKGS